MKDQGILAVLLVLWLPTFAQSAAYSPLGLEFADESGVVKSIRVGDAASMNWVGFHGRWGEPTAKGRKLSPSQVTVKPEGVHAVWSDGSLAVEVVRTPSADFTQWQETYRFRNLSSKPLVFKPNDLAIRVLLADDYKSGAAVCLTARCHAHLWAEGNSAWICALQMNSKPPHLGVVLTQGALDGYSIADREWDSNDRGAFLIHPAVAEIPAKGSAEISWTIFTHQGWDDFFAKAKALNPAFIRLSAERYTVSVGEPITISAESATSLQGAELTINGKPVETKISGGRLTCTFTPATPGEQVAELKLNGRREKLVALVTPKPDDLLRARAEFLMNKKQLLDPKSPHDGSFPVLDLDTGKFVFDGNADHNSSRERMGSGAFIGLMWLRTPDGEFRDRLKVSFLRYYAFINREIQNPAGVVANDVGDFKHLRLYSYPWAADAHLCAWHMTGDKACLQRLMANLRDFYGKRNGAHFYVICQPIAETLSALKEAGLVAEYQEALGLFKKHADTILATGINIPRHEVAYEQSIMGPAMQITAETALVTGGTNYFAGAEMFRPMLEAFGGRQPHYRLYDIGIRHWDGYWFGKPRNGGRLYGDVMPHYWSTITAEAFRFYAAAAQRPEYFDRARQILLANFSQFDADGAGHCAYLYPRSVNGNPAQYQDPYDNDQDWTLVHYLLLERMFTGAPAAAEKAGTLSAAVVSPSIPMGAVNARDFGAMPDDGVNDLPALRKAVAEVVRRKNCTLVIPPGRYDLSDPQAVQLQNDVLSGKMGANFQDQLFNRDYRYVTGLDFTGAQNVTVDARGVEFLMDGWMEPVSLQKCNGVTINGLTIDYKRPPNSEGRIIAAGNGAVDVKFADWCPVSEQLPFIRMMVYDDAAKSLCGEAFYCTHGKLIAPQTLRFSMNNGQCQVGRTLMGWHGFHFRPAILLYEANNTVLNDVTIHAQPGMGIVGHLSENITLNRLRIMPREGRHFSSNTDATHFVSCRGLVRFDHCEFGGQGDDSTNLHVFYTDIRAVEPGNRAIFSIGRRFETHSVKRDYPRVGDKLAVINRRTLEETGYITVKSVALMDDKDWSYAVTYDGTLPADFKNYTVADISACPALEFVNCHVHSHRARGILIKTRRVLIENCTIENTTGSAIHIGAEGNWMEGVASADVVVRNNHITHCGLGGANDGTIGDASGIAVDVNATDRSVPGLHKRLLFENNTITGGGGSHAISVRGAEDVTIRNNVFKDIRGTPVDVGASRRVQVSDNRETPIK